MQVYFLFSGVKSETGSTGFPVEKNGRVPHLRPG